MIAPRQLRWRSLETKLITTAKLKLADVLREERALQAAGDGQFTPAPTRSDMLPAYFSRIVREGRAEDLEVVFPAQFPKDYARIVRSSVTEWVLFNTVERDELDAVRPYFPGVDRAAQLRPDEFIAVNRHTGAELAGRVF